MEEYMIPINNNMKAKNSIPIVPNSFEEVLYHPLIHSPIMEKKSLIEKNPQEVKPKLGNKEENVPLEILQFNYEQILKLTKDFLIKFEDQLLNSGEITFQSLLDNSEFMDMYILKIMDFWKEETKINQMEYSPKSINKYTIGKFFVELFTNEKRYSMESILSKSLIYYSFHINSSQLSSVCHNFLSSKSVLEATSKEEFISSLALEFVNNNKKFKWLKVTSSIENDFYQSKLPFVEQVTDLEEIVSDINLGNPNYEINYTEILENNIKNYSTEIIKTLEEERESKILNKSDTEWSNTLKFFSVIKRAQEDYSSLFPHSIKRNNIRDFNSLTQQQNLNQKIEDITIVLDRMKEILDGYESSPDQTKLYQVSTLMNAIQPRIKSMYSDHQQEIFSYKESLLYVAKIMKEIVEKTRYYVLSEGNEYVHATVESPQVRINLSDVGAQPKQLYGYLKKQGDKGFVTSYTKR
eukprot:TRINITY_DN12658_c0_g1_i1.p1 TRINITY_DN12658_c0_g1~~TRINITY_DN12658_c0_g1_i1.p1  ORF type:complete len:466 (-),score=106.81 TRINITY_DN12658_c0_g1_i1:29-1426(-)